MLGSVNVGVKQLLETKGDPLRVGILDASGAPLNANATLCVSATLTLVSVCDAEIVTHHSLPCLITHAVLCHAVH